MPLSAAIRNGTLLAETSSRTTSTVVISSAACSDVAAQSKAKIVAVRSNVVFLAIISLPIV